MEFHYSIQQFGKFSSVLLLCFDEVKEKSKSNLEQNKLIGKSFIALFFLGKRNVREDTPKILKVLFKAENNFISK